MNQIEKIAQARAAKRIIKEEISAIEESNGKLKKTCIISALVTILGVMTIVLLLIF